MSNLTPTPRVDKNGQTVIRHMKPEVAATPRSIPTVGSLMKQISARDRVMKHYLESASNDDKDNVRTALTLLHEDDPATLIMIDTYLTTGSDEARTSVDKYVGLVLDTITVSRHNAAFRNAKDWKQKECPDVWAPTLPRELRKRWNALNLAVDSGLHVDYDDPQEYFDWIRSTATLDTVPDTEEDRDEYWRGLGALTLVQFATDEISYWDRKGRLPYTRRFVEVAGSHPEVKEFLALAIERETVDSDAINAILEHRNNLTPSLYDGAL